MNKDFARRQMVQQQVRAWDVLDHRILDVISKLPREKFVPPGFERLAFADLEIVLLDALLRLSDGAIQQRVLQFLTFFKAELLHVLDDIPRAEQAHEIVFQRHKEV